MRPGRWLSLTAIALAASAAAGEAGTPSEPRAQRLVRVYDWTNGFPWSFAGGVDQDRRGFLWVTTTSGLYRFDGTRAVRVADSLALALGGAAAGRLIVYAGSTRTYEASSAGLTPLVEEPSANEVDSISMAVASDGTPWRVRDGVVACLRPGGSWTPVEIPSTPDQRPRVVRPGRNGRVFVASSTRVWAVEPDRRVRFIADVDRALVMLERADGTILVGANQWPGVITTRLFDVTDGAPRLVFEERGSRLMSIAERGDRIWVSMDQGLQALGAGYLPQDRLTYPAIPATGPLLVDHEGSLWMATSRGLVQIPEPDVCAVLPARGGVTRSFTRTSQGAWGTFWGSLAFVSVGPRGLRMTEVAAPHYATLCRDDAGRVWTGGAGILRLDPDGTVGAHFAGGYDPDSCGVGTARRRWIVSGGGALWTVAPKDDRPRRVPVRLEHDASFSFAAEADDGTLWLAAGSKMCAAPASRVLEGNKVEWRCEEIPGGRNVIDLQPMQSGDLWALTSFPGSIRRRAGGRWEVIPGSREGVNWWDSITASPSGGVWLAGQGIVVRVAERLDQPDGWEVLERPTAWNGLITLNVVSVEEDADGTLWLGTDIGIQRIPPEIRRRQPNPPAVEFVGGSANGVPIDAASAVRLPYRRNSLEAHFAALSYRDPSAVRYRTRLHGDDPWSPATTSGRFTLVDLAPGAYELEVEASLDGARWSTPGSRLAFRVLQPWFAQPWILGCAVLGVGAVLHLGYRLRLRRRLARESQRTRIAMDLHDEVGSGLGTIAVLAGIAGRPELPQERRRDVAERIAAVSQELARSLGDIVWSLRTTSGSLDALWDQLAERARPLFASGSPQVRFQAPDPVPNEALSLVVRRNLHLVALEALHNAARHAGASSVILRLARDDDGWRLEVEDDGRGIAEKPALPSVRRGLGIEAMKARVAEMRGTIVWGRGELGGTRVTVRFRSGEG